MDLNRASGHVPPHELATAQAQAKEGMRPYWAEWRAATGVDMPLEVQSAILAGLQRGALPEERVAALNDLVMSTWAKVYEMRSSKARPYTQRMPRLRVLSAEASSARTFRAFSSASRSTARSFLVRWRSRDGPSHCRPERRPIRCLHARD